MTTNVQEIKRIEAQEVLGFDPFTDEKKAVGVYWTPPMARYVLKNLNNDNRNLSVVQVGRVGDSINVNKWQYNGDAICFNTEGNLTEGQHRLTNIADCKDDDATFYSTVSLGVVPNSFSLCATAKQRQPLDEIQRVDDTVSKSEVAILADLLTRRRDVKLETLNAIDQWDLWKVDVRAGVRITDSLNTNTSKFSTQKKTLGAWAALCYNNKCGKVAENFVELLEAEIRGKKKTKLTSEFITFWNNELVRNDKSVSNEGKLTLLYQMLCLATDRMIKNGGKADIEFNPGDWLQHSKMKNRGVYRKFLVD